MLKVKSKELRWFIFDNKRLLIENWLSAHVKIPVQFSLNDIFPRQDYYLSLPGINNLSIKLREPKINPESGKLKTALEVKRLISDNNKTDFKNNNSAFVNLWEKFSYEIIEGDENILSVNSTFPQSDKNWIRVDKNRILAKYDAIKKNIGDENTRPNEGCGIELTKIRIKDKIYYSFGLEAFSDSGKHLDDNFSACCDLIFETLHIEGLNTENSLSYPEFLSSIIT